MPSAIVQIMATRSGGKDRISTKSKLADELALLGSILTRARESRRIRQSELAQRLDMPPSYLSKIESGTRRLDVVELIRIAEAMEADPADLVRDLQREMSRAGRG